MLSARRHSTDRSLAIYQNGARRRKVISQKKPNSSSTSRNKDKDTSSSCDDLFSEEPKSRFRILRSPSMARALQRRDAENGGKCVRRERIRRFRPSRRPEQSQESGFSQRKPGNRAKSPSREQRVRPCSTARAARWASGTR